MLPQSAVSVGVSDVNSRLLMPLSLRVVFRNLLLKIPLLVCLIVSHVILFAQNSRCGNLCPWCRWDVTTRSNVSQGFCHIPQAPCVQSKKANCSYLTNFKLTSSYFILLFSPEVLLVTRVVTIAIVPELVLYLDQKDGHGFSASFHPSIHA